MYMLPKLHSTPAFPGLCQGNGGNPQGKANSADMLWEDLNSSCCWEEGRREKMVSLSLFV